MLQIDLWKRVVIWALVALGLFMALPNVFYPRVETYNDATALIERGATPAERVGVLCGGVNTCKVAPEQGLIRSEAFSEPGSELP